MAFLTCFGGEYRWSRSTSEKLDDQPAHGSMQDRHRRVLDYTPLFRFLLARVGGDCSEIRSEAVARLDRTGAAASMSTARAVLLSWIGTCASRI